MTSIESLEPLEINQERLDILKKAHLKQVLEEDKTNEDRIAERIRNSRSPFTINDMTIEEHEASLSVASKLDFGLDEEGNPRRGLYNTTEQSNVCK